jgi:hypothetical protein
MADSTANFAYSNALNSNFDITWSFYYSMTGVNGSTGGFSTFLYKDGPLSGGGGYSSLGYAPYQKQKGVANAVLGVLFDSSNEITIKSNTTFTTLTTFDLFSEHYPLIKSYQNFNIIRFNLSVSAQLLNIAIKNPINDRFVTVASIPTDITNKNTDFYKIGFGYSSPLIPNGNKSTFFIKDIQIQGRTDTPTTIISQKPYIIKQVETYYLLQSPSSDKILIENNNPAISGALLHTY